MYFSSQHKGIFVFLVGLLLGFSSITAYAIDYSKYKAYKSRQQGSVLVQGEKSAKAWQFERAEAFLKKARNMAYQPAKIKALESLISQERAKKQAEQDRQDRSRRLARRQRQSSTSSSRASSSSSCSQYVTFNFDGPGSEVTASIDLTSPSSGVVIEGNHSNNVKATAYSGCIGGSYGFTYSNNASWTNGSDQRSYSGSFSVPSSASTCDVTITDGFTSGVSVSCY